MRIVVVSAHFPPNFVSGGTLQPQRLARAMRSRGHDVSVYAGWLGDRPPLESWEQVDETGLPVRWIASGRWIGWGDERNFDNPEVGEHFADHLRRVRPDVVHLHSLQSLGGSLVGTAAASGAKVVVTMHDFWWCCPRQFLVDRSMRQCCLVVSAGTCPCEVDRDWLEARNRRLVAMLAGADLILAPSASAARVLAANGVDPLRLAVDENGLPGVDQPEMVTPGDGPGDAPGDSSGDGPVRFMYSGGSNPMKGGQVLAAAAARLVSVPGWRITVHGWEVTADYGGGEPWAGLPVDVRPPFAPADIEAVYAGADVMVVPSLMRETYSLVTREALTRGVPVVCTDTLGPEEVVEHGRNGLVVPAGDDRALAAALRSLVQEPDLLARLRAGCRQPHGVAVRSLDDQVAGLERAYLELLGRAPAGDGAGPGAPEPTPAERSAAGPAPAGPLPAGPSAAELPSAGPTPAEPPLGRTGDTSAGSGRANRHQLVPQQAAPRKRTVRRVLFVVGIEGAPLRYRARLPAEALALVGVDSDVRHYRHPDVPALAAGADAVVVYRVPATVEVLGLIASVRERGVPVLFDVDDLIFDPDVASEIPALEILPAAEAELWMEGVRRYRTTMEACDGFIGTTPALCRHATDVTGLPARQFPNGVGVLLGRASDDALRTSRRPGPPRIGYLSGTNTHDLDWAYVEPAIVEILTRHPEVELWLGGLVTTSAGLDPFSERVVCLPLLPWLELPAVLHQIDVNLAPLAPDSRFNEAKSAIKWLEAALVETPTVASATEPFREAVEPGVTGLLAATPAEWVDAIDRLLVDDDLRHLVGRRARRETLLRWSPHLQAHRYRQILEQAEVRDLPADSGWTPVAHAEPAHPIELEPYQAAPAVVPGDADVDGTAPAAPARVQAARARAEAARLVSVLRESVRTDGPRSTAVRLSRYSVRAGKAAVRRRFGR